MKKTALGRKEVCTRKFEIPVWYHSNARDGHLLSMVPGKSYLLFATPAGQISQQQPVPLTSKLTGVYFPYFIQGERVLRILAGGVVTLVVTAEFERTWALTNVTWL